MNKKLFNDLKSALEEVIAYKNITCKDGKMLKSEESISEAIRIYNCYLGDRKIPYKNARILWNCEKGKISSILVTSFDFSKRDKGLGIRSEFPYALYRFFSFDKGNADANWENTHMYWEILNLIFSYEFKDHAILKLFIDKELEKIEEYNKDSKKVDEYYKQKYYCPNEEEHIEEYNKDSEIADTCMQEIRIKWYNFDDIMNKKYE